MSNFSRIREKIIEKNLDAMLLTSEHNCRYASGFSASDMMCLVTRDSAFYLTDSRYTEAACAAITDGEVIECGVSPTRADKLRELTKDIPRIGVEERELSYKTYTVFEDKLQKKFIYAQSIMDELRTVKDESETALITKAQRIAEKAFEDILGKLRPGISEKEIAAELEYSMRLHGGEGAAFDTIAICGAKTSMPHGVPGDERVKAGDFVTMDFGCVFGGYRSDMTRTVAVGFASDEMRKVYDTVLKAQEAGIAVARGGAIGAEVHGAAAKVIADAGYGAYFGHGFGHGIGLQVHENPSFSPSNKDPVPAGAVVSAEPGIYLPGKFGVRIEDMVFLTEDGCRNLTKAPKELIVIG